MPAQVQCDAPHVAIRSTTAIPKPRSIHLTTDMPVRAFLSQETQIYREAMRTDHKIRDRGILKTGLLGSMRRLLQMSWQNTVLSRMSKRPIWAAAMVLSVVVALALVGLMFLLPTATQGSRANWAGIPVADLARGGVHLTAPVGSATVSQAQAESVALAQSPRGSTILAADLAIVSFVATPGVSTLCWVVSVDPAQGIPSSGPVGSSHHTWANYDIQVVNASDAQWLHGSAGYDPSWAGFPAPPGATP